MRKIPIRFVFGIAGALMLAWGSIGLAKYYSPKMAEKDWYPEIPFQKGMSFTTWGASDYNSTQARQELDDMKAAGIEWVAYNIWWFQDYLNSTEIYAGEWADTYANITDSFQYARSIGLHILYKPMLNLAKVYDWRSFIEFTPEWMENYTAWMVDNAIIARDGGAEILSIGCEMGNMQVHETEVRAMIAEIRAEYDGLLTYSANHDSFWHIEWWDAVDIIGVSMYSAMTTEFDPTLQELKNVWNGYYYKLENLAAEWNKSICFTEIGAQALDGSNMVPNDNKISVEQDVEELRDIYLSLFESRIWTAPWFKGTYWWIWDYYEPDPMHPEDNTGFSPMIPLVLETVTETYTADRQPVPSDILLRALIPMCLGAVCFVVLMVRPRELFKSKHRKAVDRGDAESAEGDNEFAGARSADGTKGSNFSIDSHEIFNNEMVIGFSGGVLFYFLLTNYILDVFSTIASSFSFAVLLGISPTSLLIAFGIILLLAFVIAGSMAKSHSKYTYIILFLLLIGYPYITVSNSADQMFVKNTFDLITVFLSLGGFLQVLKRRTMAKLIPSLLNGIAVLGALIGLTMLYDKTAVGFAAIPIATILFIMGKSIRKWKKKSSSSEGEAILWNKNSWKNPSPVVLVGKILTTLIVALVIGILIPIGNADYNLMSMNVLPLLLSIFPSIVGGLIAMFGFYIVALRYKKDSGGILATLSSTRHLGISTIVLGIIGIILQFLGAPPIIWTFLSGVVFVQFFGYTFIEFKKLLSCKKLGWVYLFGSLFMTFFILGIIINSIKGLIIYALTFLEFKDGAFVTRTNFNEMPQFNIPLVVKVLLILVCVILLTAIFTIREIQKKFKSRTLEFHFATNFGEPDSLPKSIAVRKEAPFLEVVNEIIKSLPVENQSLGIEDVQISTLSADIPIKVEDMDKNAAKIKDEYGNSLFIRRQKR